MPPTEKGFFERFGGLIYACSAGVLSMGMYMVKITVSNEITSAKMEILIAIDAKYATKEGLNELRERVHQLEQYRGTLR